MSATKEELQERAQLVRVLEAAAKIEFPTRDELNFRIAAMKAIGVAFNLRAVRDKIIDGPVAQEPAARTLQERLKAKG